ncbi:MAG: pantoate--beta-alanine ligase [Candidatus Polarisedimenticolia bacterium]
MELVRRVHMMREISREARGKGKKIAFVPTMGALHEGHLSLVRRARELGDIVVLSVFVNPKQFGPNEDYAKYPRDLARDADLCLREGVDYVFAPEPEDMYPPSYRTYVEVEGLSTTLEGAARPGHFRGVATVVLKLFNIVRPHFAFFGQKDAQQALLLRRMAKDLCLDVELVVCPIVRHDDGLAMSSRNSYLSPEERVAALALHRALEKARELVEERGERRAAEIESVVRRTIESEPPARLDYVAVVSTDDLERKDVVDGETLVALAAFVGPTRLIDNVIVKPGAQRAAEGDAR